MEEKKKLVLILDLRTIVTFVSRNLIHKVDDELASSCVKLNKGKT